MAINGLVIADELASLRAGRRPRRYESRLGRGRPRRPLSRSVRYRLRVATWTVVREAGQAPIRRLVSAPEDAAELAVELIRSADDDREHFWVVLLDAQNRLALVHEVSVGTISGSLVQPREVFGPALREGAVAVILVHNHPSGETTPSREDLVLTRQLSDAAKVVEIRLRTTI